MKIDKREKLNRRELLTRVAPACALACVGLSRCPEVLAGTTQPPGQEVHKFDVPQGVELSRRERVRMDHSRFIDFIWNIRDEVGDEELIRLLNIHSAARGRRAGERQAENSPDTEFQTFVATFRPPRYAQTITHEVVEDSENVFELRVTECLLAATFRDAELDGEIGNAAVCNMDYHWPTAFNPDFKMERDRTLMQGHDHCNHRYINTGNR